jgi:tRNA-2-methylthio-N6-dimethylallyladenosine synthase
MNERDSEAVAAMLRARGYSIVASEREADVILVNTCSVRDLAEQKAIGKMENLAGRKRRNPNLVIGFLGCMAQNRGAELLDRLPDLDLVIGTQKFHQVPDHLDRVLEEHARRSGVPRPARILDIGEEAGSQNTIRDHEPVDGKPTAFVSIQQGCNMACTFCIVPKTRGDERSRPMEDIVAEVRDLAARGVKEVTLLGQIVTSYGRRDYPHTGGRTPFTQLLERVSEVDGIERIRFTSPHPRGFKEDLADAFKRLPKLMPHCHLPLQSGSDRVLRLMNRPYTRDAYLRIIDRLREAREDMHFSTDVIVGFPGETEEDFAQTEDLFRRVGFDMAYIFKYSIRTGTEAADMEDQCSEVEKEIRNQRLLARLEESSKARVARMVGRTYDVLLEGPSPSKAAANDPLPDGVVRLMGRTPGNRVVHVPGPLHRVGSIVPVRIRRATTAALYGEMV